MNLEKKEKFKLVELITNVMQGLNDRNINKINQEITKLKKKSANLPEELKNDIQDFIIQADIQKDLDITHGVSIKLKQLADKLVYDLKKF